MASPAKQSLLFACLLTTAVGAVACGSSTSTDVTSPTSPTRCQASVQSTPTSFGPSGGTGTATVGVSRECAWSATTSVGWIEITSSQEGQGDATLSFRVLPNSDPVVRRGTLSVAEQRVELSQQGPPCTFSVAGTGNTVGANGGELRIDVSTHTACGWTASANVPWVTLTPPAGTGPGAIQVLVSVNPDAAVRNATIVAGGQPFAVTQASRTAPPPPAPAPSPTPPPPPPPPPNPPGPTPPPGCEFKASPNDRSFTFLGGPGSFSLDTGAGCTWSAASSAPWVTIVAGGSGSGSGEVRYLVLPNALSTQREATIRVGGTTHRIRQAGITGGDDDDDDGDDDDDDKKVELEGRISGLTGTCPAMRFTLEGRTVTTSAQTEFRGGSCSHLVNGLRVDVQGNQQSNGTVAARDVRLHR